MKSILKYFLYVFFTLLLLALTISFAIYVRYQLTVRAETGNMEAPVKPGKIEQFKIFSPHNKYVKKVWLNGVLLGRWWFKHNEIVNGGTLLFEMG